MRNEMFRQLCCRAVVEVLLAAGVDVNTRTSAGTAMHEAALCGKMEVVRALLDRGVDLGIRDSRQNTVLDLLGQFPTNVTQDITAVIKSTVACLHAIYFRSALCGRYTYVYIRRSRGLRN